MSKRWAVSAAVAAAALVAVAIASAFANQRASVRVRATLTSFEETPTLATAGRGTFVATIRGRSVAYTLTYSGLDTRAISGHIHLGARGLSGGISAFVCGGGDKPACPASGTISGTLDAGDVDGPANQGLAPGDFAKFVATLRSGASYVNVHTTRFPAGEIRGQLAAVGARRR